MTEDHHGTSFDNAFDLIYKLHREAVEKEKNREKQEVEKDKPGEKSRPEIRLHNPEVKAVETEEEQVSESIETEVEVLAQVISENQETLGELIESHDQLIQGLGNLNDRLKQVESELSHRETEQPVSQTGPEEKDFEEEQTDVHDQYSYEGMSADTEVECPVCGRNYMIQSLGRHLSVHGVSMRDSFETDEGRYECPACGRDFSEAGRLRDHLSNNDISLTKIWVREGLYDDYDEVEQDSTEEEKQFNRCEICGKSFDSSKSLANHLRQHEVVVKEAIRDDEGGYTCPECGVFRSGYPSFVSHTSKKHGFSGSNMLMQKIREEGEQSVLGTTERGKAEEEAAFVECELCGRGFESVQGLSNHFKTHGVSIPRFFQEGEDAYTCPECGEVKESYGNLSAHIRDRHDTAAAVLLNDRIKRGEGLEQVEQEEVDKQVEGFGLWSSREAAKDKVEDFFEQSTGPFRTREVLERVFDGDGVEDAYANVHKLLEEMADSGRIKSRKKGSKRLWGSKDSEPELEPNYVEQAISKYGQQEWSLLVNALTVGDDALFPSKDEERSRFGYIEFAGRFPGTAEYSSEEMWEILLTDSVVQNAVTKGTEISLKVKNSESGGGIKSRVMVAER